MTLLKYVATKYIFLSFIMFGVFLVLLDKPFSELEPLSFHFQTGQSIAPLSRALQEVEPAMATALHLGRNRPQPGGGQRHVCIRVADVVMIGPVTLTGK